MPGKVGSEPVVTVANSARDHGPVPSVRNCAVSPISPPSYSEAGPSQPACAPPSYDNLYGRQSRTSNWNCCRTIAKMHDQSKTDGEFNHKLVRAMCSTSVATVIFILYILTSLAGIVIGSLYLEDCKVKREIPISLIIHGVFALLLMIKWSVENIVLKNKLSSGDTIKQQPDLVAIAQTILAMATMISGIYGSAATFESVGTRTSESSSKDFCHPLPFYYALVMFILFSTMVLFFILSLFIISWIVWIKKMSTREPRQTS